MPEPSWTSSLPREIPDQGAEERPNIRGNRDIAHSITPQVQ